MASMTADRPQPTTSALDVGRVFREHAALVERALRRFGVAERDVHDARQEVFLVVYRKLGEFENRALLSTWLYRIAWNVASELRRKACNRHERLEPPSPESLQHDPLAMLEQRDELAAVMRALEGLDADKREVFMLYELLDLSMQEVAARVGCPLKTAFSRLYAARRLVLAKVRSTGVLGVWPALLPWRVRWSSHAQLTHEAARQVANAWALQAGLGALAALCLLLPPSHLQQRDAAGVSREVRSRARRDAQAAAPERSAPRDQQPAPAMRASANAGAAARAPRVKRTPSRGVNQPSAEPAPVSSTPAGVLAEDDGDFELIRASAVDLRPVADNPLGPALGIAPDQARPRIRLQGPRDVAEEIADQL
ncbi:MAG: RNA polymerase sigma factor [Polyangiales bacterium]